MIRRVGRVGRLLGAAAVIGGAYVPAWHWFGTSGMVVVAALWVGIAATDTAVEMTRVHRRYSTFRRAREAHVASRQGGGSEPIVSASVDYVVDALGCLWQRDAHHRWMLRRTLGRTVKPNPSYSLPWGAMSQAYGPLRPARPDEVPGGPKA